MKALLVIAPEDFRDEEYFIPKKILEDGGVKVKTASFNVGVCRGSLGGKTKSEIEVDKVETAEFEVVAFIGGQGMVPFTRDSRLTKLAGDFFESNKIVAAICIAPEILAYASVLKGKNASVTPSAAEILEKCGARYLSQPVVKDGNVITASGPASAREFGETILSSLLE